MALRMTFSIALRSKSGFASIVQSRYTQIDVASALTRLPSRVRDDVRDERLQIDPPHFRRCRGHFQPRQRQEPTDHLVQAFRVALHAIEQYVLAEALAGQSQRGVDARQRRTEFMRDVRNELPLAGDERFDALRHEVEVADQLADLVAAWASVARPRGQFAFGQSPGRSAQAQDRTGQVSREQVTDPPETSNATPQARCQRAGGAPVRVSGTPASRTRRRCRSR